ncbi:hypothetical protein DPMN_027588 [Dreissena polymorpha]|jgi:hypothetical protein|uniref:Uncharacterized protein n=1 Tax=Dreissena polymorpha TaxID=45954 RepID=A0A9D4RDS4_DREPO|nr:hypothetical protein DPMN_027588 [Dreissena polymorpha]
MPKKKKRAGVSGRRHKYHYLKKTKHESSENVNPEINFECDSKQTVQREFTDVNVQTIQTEFEDASVQAIPETSDISVHTIEREFTLFFPFILQMCSTTESTCSVLI